MNHLTKYKMENLQEAVATYRSFESGCSPLEHAEFMEGLMASTITFQRKFWAIIDADKVGA